MILPFLLANASAQENVYRRLHLGDRVQVTFLSGNTIIGDLVHIPETPDKKVDSVDYTKQDHLTLDLTWEYPGLNGTMTVRKREIKRIRILTRLDPATIDKLRKWKAEAQAALIAWEIERREYEERRKREADEARQQRDRRALEARESENAARDLAQIKREREIYGKYPPPEWGPRRLGQIKIKRLNLVPLTPDERDFEKNFELWKGAHTRKRGEQADREKKPSSKP